METQQVGINHASVKDLLALRDNRIPPARRTVVDGLWGHEVVLDSEASIETFYWCEEAADSRRARACAQEVQRRAGRTLRVSPRVLEKISERDKPDGLVSVVELPEHDLSYLDPARGRRNRPDDQATAAGLVVVADGLEIPGNLGTLIRTMDGVGADALLCVNRRVRLTHPKVFRASHGMVLHVPILDFDSVTEVAHWLAERRFTTLTLDVYDGPEFHELDYTGNIAVVLGNERYGTDNAWAKVPTTPVRLPMLGHADSLNVSVAGSIVLYHARARLGRPARAPA